MVEGPKKPFTLKNLQDKDIAQGMPGRPLHLLPGNYKGAAFWLPDRPAGEGGSGPDHRAEAVGRCQDQGGARFQHSSRKFNKSRLLIKDNPQRPWLKNYPSRVPHEVMVRDLDLGGLLGQTAGRYPDHPAVVFMDSILTYRRLDEYLDRLASALHGLGLAKGDVVGLMLPNSPQFVISFFACQRLGLIVTALNPTYRPLELKHQLGDSGAKALVVLDAVYAQVASVIGQTGIESLIVTQYRGSVQGSPGGSAYWGAGPRRSPTPRRRPVPYPS